MRKRTGASEMPMSIQQVGEKTQSRGLTGTIVWRDLQNLKPFSKNPRRHPESQIARLLKSMRRVWTNPVLVDETETILAGHGRCEAARRLGLKHVPTITILGLTAEEKRSIVIADNRLPEQAVWDAELLRHHFKELLEVDFNVELTGFSTGEVDLIIDAGAQESTTDPDDNFIGRLATRPAIAQRGEVWQIGRHKLICGDAQNSEDYARLLQNKLAAMIVADAPLIKDRVSWRPGATLERGADVRFDACTPPLSNTHRVNVDPQANRSAPLTHSQ